MCSLRIAKPKNIFLAIPPSYYTLKGVNKTHSSTFFVVFII